MDWLTAFGNLLDRIGVMASARDQIVNAIVVECEWADMAALLLGVGVTLPANQSLPQAQLVEVVKAPLLLALGGTTRPQVTIALDALSRGKSIALENSPVSQ